MVSIHRPLGYEPNTLTTAPLRSRPDFSPHSSSPPRRRMDPQGMGCGGGPSTHSNSIISLITHHSNSIISLISWTPRGWGVGGGPSTHSNSIISFITHHSNSIISLISIISESLTCSRMHRTNAWNHHVGTVGRGAGTGRRRRGAEEVLDSHVFDWWCYSKTVMCLTGAILKQSCV